MKVAVTGATGFVGRHVVAELNKRGVKTIAVARSVDSMTDLPADDFVVMDIHEAGGDVYSRLGKPDALIHLAWGGLPNYASLHHFEEELPRHYRFLRRLIEAGLPALTVAGTCFEYGMQSGELSETMVTAPANPYGYAKDALRRQLTFLQKTLPFRMIWGRLFYLYGAGQSSNSLFPQLERAVARGDRLFNMSGGEQLRDYLSVEAVAECLVVLTLSGQDVGIVNVCSGIPVSVRKLVEDWVHSKGWMIDLNLGYYPYPGYEPMAFWGRVEKLNSTIGVNEDAKKS